jgi:LCP family protein required for cell wall assembly
MEPATPGDLEAVAAATDPVVKPPGRAPHPPLYILLLGADARPGQTRSRSDTILLARVDASSKSIRMLSFPRDSRIPIPGYGMDKITHANAFGGPALVIQAVKEYSGLPIHHYIEMNLEGFVEIVDTVGGVQVTLDQPIDDQAGDVGHGLSDVTQIPAGTQVLNAEQALTFVRSRHYPDGDFTRIRNQQKFLVAFAKQTLKSENIGRLPSIAEAVADNIDTDMTIPRMLRLATSFKDIRDSDIAGYTVPGTPAMIGGVSYVIPDGLAAHDIFAEFAAD